MKRLGLIAAGVALAGCTAGQPAPTLLPWPVVPQVRLETVAITWHRVTRRQLDAIKAEACGTGPCGAAPWYGLALPDVQAGRCDVYAVEPAAEGVEVEALGHEVLHCFDGAWLPNDETGVAPRPISAADLATARRVVDAALSKAGGD